MKRKEKCLEREDYSFANPEEIRGFEFECYMYEFARHSDSVVARYRECRKVHEEGLWKLGFDQDMTWYSSIGPEEPGQPAFFPDGFPSVPFLKTNYKKLHEPVRTGPYAEKIPELKQLLRRMFRGVESAHSHRKIPDPRYHQTLYIDWDRSDTHLTKGFSSWIKEARKTVGIRATASQGKSHTKRCLRDLKRLAAYRLFWAYGMTEARRISDKEELGLYAEEPEWRKAKKSALEIIKTQFGIKEKVLELSDHR